MQKTDPKVSILMACYNGERFIGRSFESILAQTWNNIELVFVDDGSSDNSYQIAESYRSIFEKRGYTLKLIQQENQGASAAAMHAAHAASGKYLQLLDVDDYIMPDSCRLQAEFLELNKQCNVVRTNGYVVPEDNLDCTTHKLENHPTQNHKMIFTDLIAGSINNWAGAYMVRASVHNEFYASHPFFLSNYGQNLQFLLPQTVDAPAGFIDKPLFKYIRYVGSHSNQPTYEKQVENLKGYWTIRRKMLEILSISDQAIREICEIAYNRRAFNLALEFKKNRDCEFYYNKLRDLGGLSLEIRCLNSMNRQSIMQYWYRLRLKLQILIKKN